MTADELKPHEMIGIAEYVRRKWSVKSPDQLTTAIDNFLEHHPDAEHLLSAIRVAVAFRS